MEPGWGRATRAEQVTFVNGRPVENGTISGALREGYHTALMRGQHPVTFLFVELDPTAVDVNVHPAKREVRFRDALAVREAVAGAVRRALGSDRGRWSATFSPPAAPFPPPTVTVAPPAAPAPETGELIAPAEQVALRKDWGEFSIAAATTEGQEQNESAPALARSTEPAFATDVQPPADSPEPEWSVPKPGAAGVAEPKVLGVLARLYVLLENAEGLVLLDQHAAHERILFERLRRQMESEGVPSQRLLIPLTIQVAPKDFAWLQSNLGALGRMGFAMEGFGEGTLKIDAVPTFLKVADPAVAVRRLLDELRSMTTTTSRLRLGEDIIAKTVCRHAIKANDDLRLPEIQALVRDLLTCELPYCCPHGRPTMVQISLGELEKKFGRRT